MVLDIYARRLIETDSQEHILPNFLGGRLRRSGLIDKTTNDKFGQSIDAALARALQVFRVSMNARNDRGGRSAPPLNGIDGSDGAKYSVNAGGLLRVTPRMKVENRDGQLHIEGTFPDRATMEKELRKYAQGRNLDPDRLIEQAQEMTRSHREAPPMLTFKHELYNQLCYRAIAKIACNLLACQDKALFLCSEFDAIRSFILDNVQTSPVLVQAIEIDLREGGLGQLDHFVSVRSDDQGDVIGLVVFFGLLGFVVKLGSVPGLPVLTHCYRVNQIACGGEKGSDRQDDPRDLATLIPSFEKAAAGSYEEFCEIALRSLEALLPEVFAVQKRHYLHCIIAPIWERACARVNAGEELSDAEKNILAAELAEAVVDDLTPMIVQAAEDRAARAQAERQS